MNIRGEYDGEDLPVGVTMNIPINSEVKVFVDSNEERFKTWDAPETLINGSGIPSESFLVTANTTVTVRERQEHDVMVSLDGGPPYVYESALEGDPVVLETPGFFYA